MTLVGAVAGAACGNEDCDDSPYYYAWQRCPRTLDDNDRIAIQPSAISLFQTDDDADTTDSVDRRVVTLVLSEENDKDKLRPADTVAAVARLALCRPVDAVLPTTPCQTVGGAAAVACDAELAANTSDLVEFVAGAAADGDCELRSPDLANCITRPDGTAQVTLAPRVHGTSAPLHLVVESGDLCAAAPVNVGPNLQDVALQVRLGAPAFGETDCGGTGACYGIRHPPDRDLACSSVQVDCTHSTGVPILLAFVDGVEPIVMSQELEVEVEVALVGDTGIGTSGLAGAWLTDGTDCGTSGKTTLRLDAEVSPRLCVNQASATYEVTARYHDPSGLRPALASTLRARVQPAVGSVSYALVAGGMQQQMLTVRDCSGAVLEGILLEFNATDGATVVSIDPPNSETTVEGTVTVTTEQLQEGASALEVRVPAVDAMCSFPIEGGAP